MSFRHLTRVPARHGDERVTPLIGVAGLIVTPVGQPQAMLHITPEAGLAIHKLTRSQGVGEGGGLRVAARAGEQDFAMSVAALPDETDTVITEETTGARVVVDAVTEEYVDDKTLDVSDTVESTARFTLTEQGTD